METQESQQAAHGYVRRGERGRGGGGLLSKPRDIWPGRQLAHLDFGRALDGLLEGARHGGVWLWNDQSRGAALDFWRALSR